MASLTEMKERKADPVCGPDRRRALFCQILCLCAIQVIANQQMSRGLGWMDAVWQTGNQ